MLDPEFRPTAATPPTGGPTRPVPTADLPDRSAIGPVLDRQLALCRRSGQSLTLLSIGLDGLDELSARDGHALRQMVLQALWARLRGGLRASDLALRPSRDEFSAILVGARPGSVATVRTRLSKVMSQACALGGQEIVVSVRIGAGVFPHTGQNSVELLREAERSKGAWA